MRVQVLVLPVYRRHWLYHAVVVDGGGAASLASSDAAATGGPSTDVWWQAKAAALSTHFNHRVNAFVAAQWAANAAAKEGSFRSYLHRLALYVMSREDPVETFLKKLPRQQHYHGWSVGPKRSPTSTQLLEVIYPASFEQVLVRRRLRQVALRNQATHKRALLGWALACIPQAPLVLTPFPNVTLYYTVYRLISHWHAWGGAATLHAAYHNPGSLALQKRLDVLEAAGETGRQQAGLGRRRWWGLRRGAGGPPAASGPNSSAAPLDGSAKVEAESGLEALLEQLLGRRGGDEGVSDRASQALLQDLLSSPTVVFTRSHALDAVVQPLDRWHAPLEVEGAVGRLAALGYDVNGLEEHLGRVRRMALEKEAAHDEQRGRSGGKAGSVEGGGRRLHTASASEGGEGRARVAVAPCARMVTLQPCWRIGFGPGGFLPRSGLPHLAQRRDSLHSVFST